MRARRLINKSASELGAAVDRNRDDQAALLELVRELEHRTTPTARRVRDKAKIYLDRLREAPMTDDILPGLPQTPAPRDSAEVQQRRQWTLEAIGNLRAKLIDLSKRNPLISFKHSERGATYLRIVDERPDYLFRMLTEGDMGFEPLPDEDKLPPDEQTDDFLIALERMRLTDSDYLDAIAHLGDEENDAAALQTAERQLRAKVRQELNLPKLQFGKSIDIQALARAHGFDPSFELPDSDEETDKAHHRDDKIRVLLTEKQLERRLSTIHDRYRGHEREMGLHTLFLVFGFVEWFEDDESELGLHAPALLLPVHLERTLKRGRYAFTLSAGDEDLQVNVAMRELLRQRFGLEAPELRDAETPESYFIRLAGLLEETGRFSLKRFVTLAVLPFPRMVLWQDLDPERWPEDAFSAHELLVRLLGADSSGSAPSFGEDYPIDEPTFGKTVPALVTEADVSQHSALIDVAAGLPLALEGPPGTGKSQTITNMIAGALDKGQKVLFIAEKQAALGVVAERLRGLGFGPLLLELHSDRATKTGMIDSLRERVDARASSDRRNLGELQKDLENQRSQLRSYLSLLEKPLGELGRTAHQLIWRYLNLRQGIADSAVISAESAHAIEDALELNGATLQARREILDQVGAKLAELIATYGTVDGNAWTRAAKIDVLETAATLAAMRNLASAGLALDSAVERIRAETAFPLSSDVGTIPRQAQVMGEAAEPSKVSDAQLISVLAEPEEAERLLADRARWAARADAVSKVGADVLLVPAEAIDELDAALNVSVGLATAGDARADAKVERQQHAILCDLGAEAQSLAERFGLEGTNARIAQLRILCEILVERDEASETVRALCRTAIMNDSFPAILASQSRAAAELRDRRSALHGQVTPEGFTSAPGELKRIGDCLEAAGLFQRMFSGEFKQDRRTAERALGSLGDRAEAANKLRVLAQLLEDERNFESSPARPFFADGLWAGPASDWDSLAAARSLAERSYDRLANAGLDGLVASILDASALELRAPTIKATALAAPLAALPNSEKDANFSEMLASVDQRATALERLAAALGALDIADDAALLDGGSTIADSIRAFRLVDAEFKETKRPAGLGWATDPTTDASALAAALDYRSALHPDLLAMLEKSDAPRQTIAAIRAASADLMSLHSAWTAAGETVERFIEIDIEKLLGCGTGEIGALASAAERLAADEPGLRLAADVHRYLDEAGKQGCRFIVELGCAGELDTDKLSNFYELLVSRAILGHYLKGDGESLKRLGGMSLEAIRSRFREIDRSLQDVEAKRIVAERLADRSIWGRDSGPKGSWTERALIDNELSKKKRHIPIRDLTKRAGRALQSMKPVWMMSPSSVAQYVQPATVTFDLIVIDEASQMRPEYAVSSILRGRQLVVVGDSRQLPPTDFFQTTLSGMDGSDGDGDEEETLTVDTESILDLANSRIGTRRQLNWHYRSRHESLIQFSNRQFYDRRLIVFPSPDTDDPLLGVKHVFVGGTYEASINQEEAEAVIRDAIGLMITHPECSMGIATMNIKQADLINAEFMRLAGEQEAVRNYIAAFEGGIDRFFIKNLENVQGDERDIILISTVYGPDKDGRVMQRFGPIASDVGHRRLNVLVTRARLSTRVYTSLRSGDIKITETSKPGTVATQAYLTYAEGGARFELAEGAAPDSDFEVFVADRLRAAGFEVIHQVGVEKFRIDLGVRHPDYPLGFIAGIECDGATYHSGFTVRDRDKIRQSVLEGLGWNIYRIWSTDWFTDPDREAAKLIARVTQWRDESIAKFAARHASGEFQNLTPPRPIESEDQEQRDEQATATNDECAEQEQQIPHGPREVPEGRKRELDGIDWYEVDTATLYEIWPDGEYGGEVEVLSRATGAPQIYGGSVRIPKSEYRGTVEATGTTFIENDIYAAVRKVGRLAREARK